MVQNKLKSNKINITAFITCFMLIIVFVFGCVQNAFAASAKYTVSEIVDSVDIAHGAYIGYTYDFRGSTACSIFALDSFSGNICAYHFQDDSSTLLCIVSNEPFSLYDIEYQKYRKIDVNTIDSYNGVYNYASVGSKFNIYEFQSQILTFSSKEDAINYVNTGEVNNPIYQPKVNYEYDSSVEIPLMAQCQVNGHDYLFNCKQSVPHNDYKLQVAVDLRLTPIYGNFASKQYSDKEQIFRSGKIELGSYDNKGTLFNTSFSTDDLLNGIDTDRKSLGFKEFYQGYNILLPYKEPVVSEVIFYARNVSGNKCSNWVRVTFDLITETSKYEEVESVSGSNIPSDTKTSNSEYYPEDYVYNDNDAYGGGFNVSSTLNSLEHNYTQLVNFYKDLFSFLPSEIWLLLIGLVSTIVIIAIIRFVRG